MVITWRHLDQVVEVSCDSSPGRHATGHHRQTTSPLIRSFEPGEDWWWCYPDDLAFEVDGSPAAPSHP